VRLSGAEFINDSKSGIKQKTVTAKNRTVNSNRRIALE
jgi:hypothetical protein